MYTIDFTVVKSKSKNQDVDENSDIKLVNCTHSVTKFLTEYLGHYFSVTPIRL